MRDPHLTHLLDSWFNGTLTPADKKDLEQMLLSSAAARRQFWEETALHGALHETCKLKWSEQPACIEPKKKETLIGRLRFRWHTRAKPTPFFLFKAFVVAACLMILGLGIHFAGFFKG